jgi:hypothetical protein
LSGTEAAGRISVELADRPADRTKGTIKVASVAQPMALTRHQESIVSLELEVQRDFREGTHANEGLIELGSCSFA